MLKVYILMSNFYNGIHIILIKLKLATNKLLPKTGLEPARVAPHAPEACASTIPPLRH